MTASSTSLARSEEEWRAAYNRSPQRDVSFTTLSGEAIEPLCTERDVSAGRPPAIGLPGQYPFTRGVYPSMYRGRLWTMRQFAGFGTAVETNERFRYLLDHGQTGLSTAFDMPSLMGHDSDSPRSLGEVGREGVAIDTVDDMETLFAEIPLDEVTVSMTINAPAAIMLAFYVVAAEPRGISPPKLAGTIQTDILKEYIAQKEWCFPVDPARQRADRGPAGAHRTACSSLTETPIERGSVTRCDGQGVNRGNRSGSRASPGGRPGASLPRV